MSLAPKPAVIATLLAACLGTGGSAPPVSASGAVAGPPAAEIAFALDFSGSVDVRPPSRRQAVTLCVFMPVEDGAVLELAPGASVTLVCTNDAAIHLTETAQLTAGRCEKGQPLPAGTYSELKPRGGHIPSVLVEFDRELTRDKKEEYGNVPVVVSPRQTALLNDRPVIRWTEVPAAIEYEIRLNGSAGFEISPDPKQLSCGPEKLLAGAVRSCSVRWPADRDGLPAGADHFLTVAARTSYVEKPRASEERNKICLLLQHEAAEIRRFVEQIDLVPHDLSYYELSRALFLAGRYSRQGLYSAAIPLYSQALELRPSAELRVTLADAFRAVGLYRFAAAQYHKVLEDHAGDAGAAAELGLAWVYYIWRDCARAAVHADRARSSYEQEGLSEEEALAEKIRCEASLCIRDRY